MQKCVRETHATFLAVVHTEALHLRHQFSS
jgi:hypothetical protein